MAGDSQDRDPVSVSVGARVRSVRRARGLTQVELAGRAGLDQPFVSRIESGEANVELRTLARLGRALDATLQELVTGVEL